MGKPLDKRTDIWAFGCVLYECLSGRKAFGGETVTETLAAVLKGEPDWQALPASTPRKIRDLVQRCLQKDPRERLHDMADARIELQEQMKLPSELLQRSAPISWSSLTIVSVATLCLASLLGAVGMKYFTDKGPRISQPVTRLTVKLEPGHCLDGWRRSPPAGFDHPTRTAMVLSSDGRFVVYSAVKQTPGAQDKPWLYLRGLDQLEAKPIAGTEGGSSPFLSPDDRWVGFWADRKLMKVSVAGGVPTVLCDVKYPFGFSWGADNKIIFASADDSGLLRISAAGGDLEILTRSAKSKEEFAHRLPCGLPGGRGIVFTIMRHAWDPQPRLAVMELATRKWRVLLENAADARYVTTGHLAFLRQGTLLVVPFDPDRLEVTGQPVPVAANIAQGLNTLNSVYHTAAGQFSISGSGSLVYASGGMLPDMQNSLVWVDHEGKAEPVVSFKAAFAAPRLSPDGQRIAYCALGSEACDWVYDLERGMATKLTSQGRTSFVTWHPDGRRVLFNGLKTGTYNIYWQPADGSSPMERLTQSEHNQFTGACSPDGETLAFVEGLPQTGAKIMLLSLRDRKVTPYLNSRFNEMYPEFSPDGKWMAYVSDESGSNQVYVQTFPAGGGRWPISNQGGFHPLWAPSGRQLFYRSANGVWGVDVQPGPVFSASKPKLLFEQLGYADSVPIRAWDISPDGERFLMVKLEERKAQPLTEMVLVQNWIEEVRRLAPNKK
jgi:hypothetical protein